MIFLLVYDRQQGLLVKQSVYQDDELAKANADRLGAEIDCAEARNVEIVILRSDSLAELKRTHARYFKSVTELQSF